MWLFSSMGADVTSLVLEAVESLVTKWALVRPRKILSRLIMALLGGVLEKRRHEAHGGSSHGCVDARCGGMLLLVSGGVRIEKVGKTHVRGGR
jgi:hypothetical protein